MARPASRHAFAAAGLHGPWRGEQQPVARTDREGAPSFEAGVRVVPRAGGRGLGRGVPREERSGREAVPRHPCGLRRDEEPRAQAMAVGALCRAGRTAPRRVPDAAGRVLWRSGRTARSQRALDGPAWRPGVFSGITERPSCGRASAPWHGLPERRHALHAPCCGRRRAAPVRHRDADGEPARLSVAGSLDAHPQSGCRGPQLGLLPVRRKAHRRDLGRPSSTDGIGRGRRSPRCAPPHDLLTIPPVVRRKRQGLPLRRPSERAAGRGCRRSRRC